MKRFSKFNEKPMWEWYMFSIVFIVAICAVVSVTLYGETPKLDPKAEYNRIRDSIDVNHEPFDAIKPLNCWLVACRLQHPNLHDYTTVYFDPELEFVSITSSPTLNDLMVTVRRGRQMETVSLKLPTKQPYRWLPLESKALAEVATKVPPKK